MDYRLFDGYVERPSPDAYNWVCRSCWKPQGAQVGESEVDLSSSGSEAPSGVDGEVSGSELGDA